MEFDVKTYTKVIHNTLWKMNSGLVTEDRDDITQDVLIKIYNVRERLDFSQNIKAYISMSARSAYLDWYRIKFGLKKNLNNAFDIHLIEDSVPDKITNEFLEERLDYLKRFIQLLPQREQAILKLRFQGFQYQEIADELNMPLGSVKSLINRSTTTLKKYFEVDKNISG